MLASSETSLCRCIAEDLEWDWANRHLLLQCQRLLPQALLVVALIQEPRQEDANTGLAACYIRLGREGLQDNICIR